MPKVDTANGELYYQVDDPLIPWTPDDAAVLFCHGVGTNCDTWSPWLAALRQRFRVVRFDTRGFGRSAGAAADHTWSLAQLSADILAVADAAGVDRFHVIGESLGGTVCLYLATTGEPRLSSLTLASTAYRGDRIGAVKAWWGDLARDGIGSWSLHMMTQRFVEGGLSEPAWEWFEGVQRQTDPRALLNAAQLLLDTDLSDQVAAVTVPTLIINSDASPYVTPALAVDLHSRITGAELCVFPNSRHGVVFSHGEQCAALFVDFVSRRLGAPAA